MSSFQENTEFVLGKVDSLFQLAVPHLKNGAEEAIKYAVADAWISAAWFPIVVPMIVGLAWWIFSRLSKWTPKDDEDRGVKAACQTVTAVVSVLLVACCFGGWWSTAKCAVKATVSPPVYTILKLAGKDCKE